MELTNTHIRYLLAIYDLSRNGEAVSSVRIASVLQVSKPSVARMLSVLVERDMVTKERYGKVTLTQSGLELVEQYQSRLQRLMERIPAMGLKLNQEESRNIAEVLASTLPAHCFQSES